MPNNFSLHNAIYTTRSIRKFKPDPIPHDTIRLILEAGTQGPSGKNIQPWRFIVVQGPKQKKQLARLYSEAFFENRPSEIDDPDTNASAYLARNLDKAPAIIVVCAPVTQPTGIGQIGPFASTFPAIQNMLLTARAHGMGGTITINHVFRHEDVVERTAVVHLEGVADELGNDRAGASPRPDRPSSRTSLVLKHDLPVQLLVYKRTFLN